MPSVPGHPSNAGHMSVRSAWSGGDVWAGLTGVLRPDPIGTYLYEKLGRTHYVTVYILQVTGVADEWPEKGIRERSWLTPNQAVATLDDPGLCEIIRAVEADPALLA